MRYLTAKLFDTDDDNKTLAHAVFIFLEKNLDTIILKFKVMECTLTSFYETHNKIRPHSATRKLKVSLAENGISVHSTFLYVQKDFGNNDILDKVVRYLNDRLDNEIKLNEVVKKWESILNVPKTTSGTAMLIEPFERIPIQKQNE